ncbi:uncharacterized protein LOC126974354 [Leptidea sinapis]|uniref:uncharacterized protein LOC126974354 n=1 Tax=Leptidea sinapis TaxID=189913 RepID=UPI0021C25C14|nr:uncharacterized protein LOC126974354 [Leptidea sinapis]
MFSQLKCTISSETNGVTKCSKCVIIKNIYAGLLILMVFFPFILTQRDRRLTYDEIYNNTAYAQIRPLQRIYQIHNSRNAVRSREKLAYRSRTRPQLLVGTSHDPFRYSIPEADYLKGVRVIEPPASMNNSERAKRGVLHLYNMLTCATGCDPVTYKGYGCYCGIGGTGRPMDGIDNCCKIHDECYDNIRCAFYTVYFQPYYWTCFNNEPLCALENHLTRHQYINGCAGRLCECDRRFAMCVKQYTCPIGRPLCTSSPFRFLQNVLIGP